MKKRILKKVLIFIFIFAWLFTGWPQVWQNPRIPPEIKEVFAATETIRPTDAYNPGGFDTPEQGYDGNTETSALKTDLKQTPGISFGGASTLEDTNAWQSKSQTWTSATLYLSFSKTVGKDDTVEVLVVDQDVPDPKHIIVTSTTEEVTKQEFSQVLNSANWGGYGFPNIARLRVRVNGAKTAGPDGATSYMYDVRIDGGYTPVTVSVSVSDGTVAYGMLGVGNTASTTLSGLNDTQTATNDGNVTENFNIKGQDSANWTLSASAGAETYKHEFCITDCDTSPSWTALTTSYQTLATGITSSGNQTFDLQITIPTSTSNYTEQSVDITVQAVAG